MKLAYLQRYIRQKPSRQKPSALSTRSLSPCVPANNKLKMSHTPSRSPKRKRSTPSPDRPAIPTPENGSLEYAYDEELPSELQTPRDDEDEVDGLRAKRPRWERPRRLNYFPHMTLHGHRRGVAGVRFSPDGEWIASCCMPLPCA